MPGQRRRKAQVGGLAASLIAHVAVLAVLAFSALPRLGEPSPDRSREIEVRLVDLTPASGRPASRAQPATEPDRTLTPVPVRPTPAPSPVLPAAPPNPSPSKPSGPPAPPAVAAQGTGVHPGPLPGAETGGDFKGFLRAGVGCAHRDGVGLTRVEREACDQKAGEVAKAAPTIDKIAPEKRAYYDTVAATYAAMRYPTPVVRTGVLGGNMYTDPATAMPGHMPGVGCKIAFGKPRGWKGSKSGPAHSLNLGPCFVTPPQGVLTEEADIKPPPSLREREDNAKSMRDLDPPSPSKAPVSPPGT